MDVNLLSQGCTLPGSMSWMRSPSNVPQSSSQPEAPSQSEFFDLNDVDPSQNEEDDCEMGELQGDTVPSRVYKKGPWNISDLMVMFAVKKIDWFTYGPSAGSKALHKPGHERWALVSENCFQQGISRSGQQCQDMFEGVRGDFQKIWDYEKNILSGKKSYWTMDASEKKAIRRLKATMHREVYDYIASWLPDSSRSTNPTELIDSLNTVDDTDGERDQSPESSLYTGKCRRSLPKVSDGLAFIMETNREKTIAAMIEGEDRVDARQAQLLDLELKKHNDNMALKNSSLHAQKIAQKKLLVIEENKIQVSKETSQGFIRALMAISTAIGSKMQES